VGAGGVIQKYCHDPLNAVPRGARAFIAQINYKMEFAALNLPLLSFLLRHLAKNSIQIQGGGTHRALNFTTGKCKMWTLECVL